jgi:AmiR/NasT family two-component response regulator
MDIRTAIAELQTMSIGLFHTQDADGRLIAEQLKRLGLHCECRWPPTLQNLGGIDFVILSLVPEIVSKFGAALMREFRRKVVVSVVGYESPTVLSLACQINSSAMLFSPVRPFGVLSSIVLALCQHKSAEELQKRIQKLESRLENVRLIEQAKRFLMETRGLSEDDAFRLLRNRAMERRCSIEETASSIVDARNALVAALGSYPSSTQTHGANGPIRRVK